MKKCPYCAEEIQDEAIKCRYCGEFLNKKKKWLNCFFSCLIVSIIAIFSIIAVIFLGYFLFKLVLYRIFYGAIHNFTL